MVTALFVQNYSPFQFNCQALLDCESGEICDFVKDLKPEIKPGYAVRVAQLTRDYLFHGGVCYYFSFLLSIPGNRESILILKVKNQDSDTAANLLFGVHALPFGTATPEFQWHRSTSWHTCYWKFRAASEKESEIQDPNQERAIQCLEIRFRARFTGGDSDLEFLLLPVPTDCKKYAQIQGDFSYNFTVPPMRDLRITQVAWHRETKGLFADFKTASPKGKDLFKMHLQGGDKVFSISNLYLSSPRWTVLSPWKAVEEDEEKCWSYSERLSESNWTSKPKNHPLAIRRRCFVRELLCKDFYPEGSEDISLQRMSSFGEFSPCENDDDGGIITQMQEMASDSARLEWLMMNNNHLKLEEIDQMYIENILKTFRFEIVKARVSRVLGFEPSLGPLIIEAGKE